MSFDLDEEELKATRILHGVAVENSIEKFKKKLREYGCYNEVTEDNGRITVEGGLDLSNTNISELPDNLTVGGNLGLSNTNISELPDNLMAEGNIYGFNEDKISRVKPVQKGYNKERNYIYFDGILWGNVKSVKNKENIITDNPKVIYDYTY